MILDDYTRQALTTGTDAALAIGIREGNALSFDRLANHLATLV
jgi:hypothetical protein